MTTVATSSDGILTHQDVCISVLSKDVCVTNEVFLGDYYRDNRFQNNRFDKRFQGGWQNRRPVGNWNRDVRRDSRGPPQGGTRDWRNNRPGGKIFFTVLTLLCHFDGTDSSFTHFDSSEVQKWSNWIKSSSQRFFKNDLLDKNYLAEICCLDTDNIYKQIFPKSILKYVAKLTRTTC